MSRTKSDATGCSSATDGYTAGGAGQTAPTEVIQIDKFSFASNTTATDHGDLLADEYGTTGCSSTTHGYVAGGSAPVSNVHFSCLSNSSVVGTVRP